ncbi:MAG: CYTH domain-containing protein [Elusimicrobia bacterium]|nr:CYTH domain-containing protein [Elusimicrobiota bacterium]
MKDKVELEAKWSVQSEKGFAAFQARALQLGASFAKPRLAVIHDLYLDTLEGFFGKRGISCRLRHTDGLWELTLKSRSALKGGLASRRERTYAMDRVSDLTHARRRARKFLSGIPGHESLETLFAIVNRRSVCRLSLPQGVAAEAAFDRVVIGRGRRRVRMLEVELEHLEGDKPAFLAFVRRLGEGLGFAPAARSKVATALAAFSLERRPSGKPDDVFGAMPDEA